MTGQKEDPTSLTSNTFKDLGTIVTKEASCNTYKTDIEQK